MMKYTLIYLTSHIKHFKTKRELNKFLRSSEYLEIVKVLKTNKEDGVTLIYLTSHIKHFKTKRELNKFLRSSEYLEIVEVQKTNKKDGVRELLPLIKGQVK